MIVQINKVRNVLCSKAKEQKSAGQNAIYRVSLTDGPSTRAALIMEGTVQGLGYVTL